MQQEIENAAAVERENQTSQNIIKLDYSIEEPEDRVKLVQKIIETLKATSPEKLNNRYLEILADYIIFAMNKKQRKTKNIN